MNAKAIGVIIAFTALTTALNFVRIPAPYFPMVLSYQLSDVVLIIAFLLFGLRAGIVIAGLNMLIKMTVFPDPSGFVGPPYYLIAFLSMFFGVFLFEKLVKRQDTSDKHNTSKNVTISTALGTFTRTLIMLPLDYVIYGYLVYIVTGYSLSEVYAGVIVTMPYFIIYNITVPLVMIPTSYFIAMRVSKYTSSMFKSPFVSQKAP